MTTHSEPCGCTFGIHETKAMYRIARCDVHASKHPVQNRFTQKHYANMGALGPVDNYIKEFIDGFGELPKTNSGHLVEFGGGASPYIEMIRSSGYVYTGVEFSHWACKYMRERHHAEMIESTIEGYRPYRAFDVVLAAHVIEHVDAPKGIAKAYESLRPGGIFYMLIPEGTDLYNQDHLWFMDQESGTALLRAAEFHVHRCEVKSIVPKERFMYFTAIKPPSVLCR